MKSNINSKVFSLSVSIIHCITQKIKEKHPKQSCWNWYKTRRESEMENKNVENEDFHWNRTDVDDDNN